MSGISNESGQIRRIGQIICELTEGEPGRTIMLQKILEKINMEEKLVRAFILSGKHKGYFDTPTTNQVKLTNFGLNSFCSN